MHPNLGTKPILLLNRRFGQHETLCRSWSTSVAPWGRDWIRCPQLIEAETGSRTTYLYVDDVPETSTHTMVYSFINCLCVYPRGRRWRVPPLEIGNHRSDAFDELGVATRG